MGNPSFHLPPDNMPHMPPVGGGNQASGKPKPVATDSTGRTYAANDYMAPAEQAVGQAIGDLGRLESNLKKGRSGFRAVFSWVPNVNSESKAEQFLRAKGLDFQKLRSNLQDPTKSVDQKDQDIKDLKARVEAVHGQISDSTLSDKDKESLANHLNILISSLEARSSQLVVFGKTKKNVRVIESNMAATVANCKNAWLHGDAASIAAAKTDVSNLRQTIIDTKATIQSEASEETARIQAVAGKAFPSGDISAPYIEHFAEYERTLDSLENSLSQDLATSRAKEAAVKTTVTPAEQKLLEKVMPYLTGKSNLTPELSKKEAAQLEPAIIHFLEDQTNMILGSISPVNRYNLEFASGRANGLAAKGNMPRLAGYLRSDSTLKLAIAVQRESEAAFYGVTERALTNSVNSLANPQNEAALASTLESLKHLQRSLRVTLARDVSAGQRAIGMLQVSIERMEDLQKLYKAGSADKPYMGREANMRRGKALAVLTKSNPTDDELLQLMPRLESAKATAHFFEELMDDFHEETVLRPNFRQECTPSSLRANLKRIVEMRKGKAPYDALGARLDRIDQVLQGRARYLTGKDQVGVLADKLAEGQEIGRQFKSIQQSHQEGDYGQIPDFGGNSDRSTSSAGGQYQALPAAARDGGSSFDQLPAESDDERRAGGLPPPPVSRGPDDGVDD